MATFRASFETVWRPDEAFAYLSDFSTSAEWDPGVVEADRVGAASVGEGTEFRVVAEFLGRKAPLIYRVVEFEPARAVTFVGESAKVVSRDRITFEILPTGTRVSYDTDLSLKGPLRLADPLLALAFNRVGDRALAGLRKVMGQPAPGAVDAAT